MGVALDLDAETITFYKNNVSQGAISLGAQTKASGSLTPTIAMGDTSVWTANFGQDSSFAGAETAQGNQDANMTKGISITLRLPADHLALCTDNLEDPSIALPGEYFNTVLYSGDNATSRAITGVGFQPDFSWIKARNTGYDNQVFDVVRGVSAGTQSQLSTNLTAGVPSSTNGNIKSFDSDGFSIEDGTSGGAPRSATNLSGTNYVSWNWKAGGAASANTDGTINSSVSVNATAGFSIVSYTGSGSAGTVGHGLSQKPDMIIVKKRSGIAQWPVGVEQGSMDWTDYIALDKTNNSGDYDYWNDTAPTSSVFSLSGDGDVNQSTGTFISYCFHSVEGYSKVGTYIGNANGRWHIRLLRISPSIFNSQELFDFW